MVMSVEGEERLMDDYRTMEREKQLEMLWETVMKISPLALTVSRMRDSVRQAQTRIKLVEKRLYQQVGFTHDCRLDSYGAFLAVAEG